VEYVLISGRYIMEYSVKVTRIKNRYHARLYLGNDIISETACELRIDIGHICRYMMRWEDKMGGDIQTSRSRKRLNTKPNNYGGPIGKVWYNIDKMNKG
jgi:hypothetical protein